MASATGAWGGRNAGNNRGRLRVVTSQSPSSVGSGTSSVTLTVDVYLQSEYGVVWNGFSVSISGALSWTGSADVNHGSGGGETRIARRTLTVSTQYASTVSRRFTASISGLNLFPTPPSVSVTHVVPARPISKPNAATGVSASRSSDTRQNVSWSVSSTSARPISSQTVQRRETNSAGTWLSWKNVSGTLSGGARSWADSGTVANRQYQYRVVTRNSAGSATSSRSLSVRTTPAAPSIGSAVKQPDGSVRVSFTPNTPYSDYLTHVLQDNPGGTGWVTVKTQAGSGAFVHEDPNPAVTHRYRVATRSTYSNPGTLTSAYSAASNIVQLLAAPDAPTRTAPSGVLDRDADIPFAWSHNAVDSSDQTAYELRYRVNGGAWVTLTGTTASTRTLTALGVSGTVEWQVRTKGAHPDWSPWSSIGSFTLAATPTVAINSPDGSDLHESRVTLLIGYDQQDGSPQSRVQAELVHDGTVVETLSWSGTGDTGVFKTALDDDTEYTVRVRVQAGNGLWSDWDSVTFTTEFPAPSPVAVVGEWDRDSGAVVLDFEIENEPAEYRWTGVPGASVSEKVVGGQVVARNLIHNGSFEYVDGSDVPLGWQGNYATIMAASMSEAGVPSDFFFAPYGGVVGDRLGIAVGEDGESVYVSNSTPFPVTAGEWVGFGALVSTYLFPPEARIGVRFLDDNNAAVGGLAGTEYEYAAYPDGTEIIGAAQVPAGATRARVLVYAKENPPHGVALYVDAVRADTAASELEALNAVQHYFDGDTQAQAPIEALTVQRRDTSDSPWVTIAEHVDPGTTITDPVPALGAPEYRAISHTALPSSTTGPVLELPWVHGPHDLVYVNTGPGFELVGTARGDQASNEYAIEQSSFHAAGIELPIAIFGTSETGSVSFTGRIFDPRIGVEPVTTRDEWRALLRHRQVVCYRDCQGRKMFGLLGVSFSQQGPIETVQITVDEVWHEEGAIA